MKIARLDQIAPGTATAVSTYDGKVAVFNRDGSLTALDDSCLRCGRSLAAGTLEDDTVRCSGCDWRYDVTNGCVNGIPALRTETFAVTVVDGDVMLVHGA